MGSSHSTPTKSQMDSPPEVFHAGAERSEITESKTTLSKIEEALIDWLNSKKDAHIYFDEMKIHPWTFLCHMNLNESPKPAITKALNDLFCRWAIAYQPLCLEYENDFVFKTVQEAFCKFMWLANYSPGRDRILPWLENEVLINNAKLSRDKWLADSLQGSKPLTLQNIFDQFFLCGDCTNGGPMLCVLFDAAESPGTEPLLPQASLPQAPLPQALKNCTAAEASRYRSRVCQTGVWLQKMLHDLVLALHHKQECLVPPAECIQERLFELSHLTNDQIDKLAKRQLKPEDMMYYLKSIQQCT